MVGLRKDDALEQDKLEYGVNVIAVNEISTISVFGSLPDRTMIKYHSVCIVLFLCFTLYTRARITSSTFPYFSNKEAILLFA